MKKALIVVIFLAVSLLTIRGNFYTVTKTEEPAPAGNKTYREITGTIKRGETFFDIFKRYSLDVKELFKLKEATADIYRLRQLYPDRQYQITIDGNNQINSLKYWIDDDYILNIDRTESGFSAQKIQIEYEKRIFHIGRLIQDNLVSSAGEGSENLKLALQLSDIFAWDIDFTTDLRNGDTFKIVVEGLYRDGEFKKYGNILSAEFVNDGRIYRAYRFKHDGNTDYYDEDGKSLRRAFLKAPLNFRRISSGFSGSRFHPVLKIYRPHHGLDYAAPARTPVSAVGDGTVTFSGYKGQYGNLMIIKHPNGWQTYYGHLSKFGKGVRKGVRVTQGQIIGFVGATGLATGPHLHYEIRINDRPVNPLTVKMPKGEPIPNELTAEFRQFKNEMDPQLASIKQPVFAFADQEIDNTLNRKTRAPL